VTLQAGAQRILDAVRAARDDIAAVSGQIRGTVTLRTTFYTATTEVFSARVNPAFLA
jgi:hypothetical protein